CVSPPVCIPAGSRRAAPRFIFRHVETFVSLRVLDREVLGILVALLEGDLLALLDTVDPLRAFVPGDDAQFHSRGNPLDLVFALLVGDGGEGMIEGPDE